MTSSRFLYTALAALAIAGAGCSSSTGGGSKGTGGGPGTGGTSGEGGTEGSGGVASSGGFVGSGGQAAGGGASATGGRIGSGGSSAAGGATGTGGQAPGGGVGAGGSSASGGKSGGGGVSSTGGASMGGASGTGGSAGGGSGGSGGSSGKNSDGGISDGGGRDGGSTARDAAGANTPEGGGGGSGGFDPCPAAGDCKILPLGDSITAGAGAQPGDNGGYRVELFTKAVNDSKHITFVGSLSSGPDTVASVTFPKNHEGHIGWVITQINNIATTAQTVSVSGTSYAGALRDMPNIVLLFIGTNDEGYASSEAGASDRLGTLIDKIVAALPNALLVVSSIYPFPGCQSTNYTPTQCAGNVATYDAAIPGAIQQRVAQGKHVLFVDMSTPPTGALSTDGVHPNDTVGYPWMADNWYTAIKSYLH